MCNFRMVRIELIQYKNNKLGYAKHFFRGTFFWLHKFLIGGTNPMLIYLQTDTYLFTNRCIFV